MTTDEHKNIIGGAVLEYSEVKRQLAALHLEVQNTLSHVRKAEEVLRFKSLGDRRSDEEVDEYLKNWPSVDRLRDLMAQLKTGLERKAMLEKTLKDHGIEF